jgi:hypothetical protein
MSVKFHSKGETTSGKKRHKNIKKKEKEKE